MELYHAGKTLFIEAGEGEESVLSWWQNQTISRVVRLNVLTGTVMIAERYPQHPSIITWMNPVTFEDEQRMCCKWKITHKYREYQTLDDMFLPINDTRYTLRDRIRERI